MAEAGKLCTMGEGKKRSPLTYWCHKQGAPEPMAVTMELSG